MVNNNNLIPKEIIPKTEEIREMDHQTPTFEEFMKSYEGNVNYADLSGGDVGESRGCGPCTDGRPRSQCNCTPEQLWEQLQKATRRFRVIMNTEEWDKNHWLGEMANNTFFDVHWYSDRKNHGNIPGNWVEKTWGNLFGGNIQRIGDWEATEIRLESIEQGKRVLEHMDRGWLKIRMGKNIIGTVATSLTFNLQSQDPTVYVKNNLRQAINDYEKGKNIDTNINFS